MERGAEAMKLDTEFCKLPLCFDADRLAHEVAQFSEAEWRAHPQGHAGNSAVPLIAVGGDPGNDGVKGPMRPTPQLGRCPYLQQVLAAFQSVLGRTRLMRIAGQGEATAHVDTNYYWLQRVRIHVPVVTFPEVTFQCGGRSVHMAAGEAWIFDTWRLHNVLNPNSNARIHLVADTVGSAFFWDLVAQGERPGAEKGSGSISGRGRPCPDAAMGRPEMVSDPFSAPVELETEAINFPVVMTPWEQECLLVRFVEDLGQAADSPADVAARLEETLERFHRQWRQLWARYGAASAGWPAYRQTLAEFEKRLQLFAGGLRLPNDLEAVEILQQMIVRPALNPDLAEEDPRRAGDVSPPRKPQEDISPLKLAQGANAPRSPQFDRPIFIVAAPRSGSTLLFETLARSPSVCTIGGESHEIIEGIAALNPARRGFDSNRLTAADATTATAEELRAAFHAQLRDRDGRPPQPTGGLRLLEKTPKNALRIPFLKAVFPDALFIYLYREPHENLGSIIDAWQSGRFVTYPQLPGWEGLPWSLLLVPEWRQLLGQPLATIAAMQWASANRHILDDLTALPAESWCGVHYTDLVADPQGQAERLCRFADIAWDQHLNGRLPLSRYTLTPPDPNKWRQHEAELASVFSQVEALAQRAQQAARRGPVGLQGEKRNGLAGMNRVDAVDAVERAEQAAQRAERALAQVQACLRALGREGPLT